MPRTKTVVPGRARRKKVMKAVKGNFQGRRKLYQTAKETLLRSMQFAYEHRRTKKREFRALWITRINAAARIHGLSYSALISGLKSAEITINRKVLADLAVNDMPAFAQLAEVAKQAQAVCAPPRFWRAWAPCASGLSTMRAVPPRPRRWAWCASRSWAARVS